MIFINASYANGLTTETIDKKIMTSENSETKPHIRGQTTPVYFYWY